MEEKGCAYLVGARRRRRIRRPSHLVQDGGSSHPVVGREAERAHAACTVNGRRKAGWTRGAVWL